MITVDEFLHDDIDGLKLAQNKHIDTAFLALKNKYKQPQNIIEIGTCWGGFALFLAKMFPESHVHTFDIEDWGDKEYLKRRNQLFKEHNISYYNEDYGLRNGKRIKALLNDKSILLCDGAHKENEFTFFIDKIKKNSIIMAHDFGRNRNHFVNNIQGIYWGTSFEFDGSHFDDRCRRKRLIPYFQNEFEKAVWYIREKI